MLTISQIIAAVKGTRPWYTHFNDLAKIVQGHSADIGNLSVGSPLAQFATYDTRFYVTEDSMASNAYVATLSPVATGLALPTGYRITFMPSTSNTGAATLDVGSTDGAVNIKAIDRSGATHAKRATQTGDILSDVPLPLVFDGTDWIIEAFYNRLVNSNTTLNVASSGGDFTTVGAAYDSLDDAIIMAGVTVTISVAAGTFVESTINIDHPQGGQINIVGAGKASTTLSFSADGSHGIVANNGAILGLLNQLTILSTSTSNHGISLDLGAIIICGQGMKVDGFQSCIRCDGRSYIEAKSIELTGADWYGAYVSNHSYALLDNANIYDIVNFDGILAEEGAEVTADTATTTDNGRYGVGVRNNGHVNAAGLTGSGNGTALKQLSDNTVATDGSLIYI